MRDAAGQLAERFEPLAVFRRLLGFASLHRFEIEPAGASERKDQQQEE
jgi:hypothetical protein